MSKNSEVLSLYHCKYSREMITYSENFKKQLVRDVESGKITKEEARRKYNIGGHSTVLKWCRKYGKTQKKSIMQELLVLQDKTNELAYKKRITELERQLSDSRLEVNYLNCVIKEIEIDVKEASTVKKSVCEQLTDVTKKRRK